MRISLKPLGENFIVGLFTGRIQHLLFWSVILTALSSHLHAQTSTTKIVYRYVNVSRVAFGNLVLARPLPQQHQISMRAILWRT